MTDQQPTNKPEEKPIEEQTLAELLHISPRWTKEITPVLDNMCIDLVKATGGVFNTLDIIRLVRQEEIVANDAEMSFVCLYVGYRAGMMKEGQSRKDEIIIAKP